MKTPSCLLLTLALSTSVDPLIRPAFAQNESIIVEAESGAAGSQFSLLTDSATGAQYVTILGTAGGFNPGVPERTLTYTVTFPSPGVYELYGRVRVGPATFSDDSFYYANGFGTKNPAFDNDWILANGLAGNVGFTLPGDKVVGGGPAASGVWKWVKLSAFDGGEPPAAGFNVPAGALQQTFQIAGREDGLDLDKFAFGRQGVFFTVFDLDNGLPGTTVPPPPPYVPPGPPIATGQPKFLGGVWSPSQVPNATAYFNQLTPENAGKWGSVEPARDVMNFAGLDAAYALAKSNGFPFRMHTLIWGNQQPPWIESLPAGEQREEIEEWFAAVAARYPDIDFIDVVNEPLHDPPAGATNGNYIDALGGAGASGWEWVLQSFRLARQYFPHARLGLNEFSVTNNTTDMLRYIGIVNLLKAEGLIDTVGVQGHAFSTRVPNTTTIANLDLLAATDLPIYVTELDIDGPTDEVQLADYQRIFPAFWEHPGVRGITLWGYRPGHWRTAQGAYIAHENGAERPALVWLIDYVAHAILRPWMTAHPASQTVAIGDSISFACAGDGTAPLAYQWRKDGAPIVGNASASTPTLTLSTVAGADAGNYDCVVANTAGSAVSRMAALAVVVPAAGVIVNHAPVLNGWLDGAVQVLLPESMTLNGSARVSGDLLIPGLPAVRLNGQPTFGGTLDASGSATPSNHTVTLNGGAQLGRVIRRVDGTALPALPIPPAPAGTRDVVINMAGQSAGDFATLRNLTLNGGAGDVAIPAGTYGTFTANSQSGIVLGVTGSATPAIYNLQGLTLNSGSSLRIAGPVIVTVAGSVIVNGSAAAGNGGSDPSLLQLNIASGGLTLNGGATFTGAVTAPSGTVIVNGTLNGRVIANRLILNGNGALHARE